MWQKLLFGPKNIDFKIVILAVFRKSKTIQFLIPKWWLEFWFLLFGRKSDFCNSVYIYDSNNHSAQQCRTKKKFLTYYTQFWSTCNQTKNHQWIWISKALDPSSKDLFLKQKKRRFRFFFFLHLSVIFLKEIWCLFFLFNSVASVLPDVDFFLEK